MEPVLSKFQFAIQRIIGVCRGTVLLISRKSKLSRIFSRSGDQLGIFDRRGQMAIFVALIFQILFLFFAMAINIGLAVHDKINLQNAVDLAAYYMAQKQAEQLNLIAHTNYQIRQAWKLLNWRYYVLGTMGRETPPAPLLQNYLRIEAMDENVQYPTMCTTFGPTWIGMPVGSGGTGADNICKRPNIKYPTIKPPGVVAPFLPFNLLFDSVARAMSAQIQKNCDNYSGVNWWFAANAYTAFMFDQMGRKELIRAVARNLGQKADTMIDLHGDTVAEGATKTFRKNLTSKNNQSLVEMKMFNSMEVVGDDYQKWLNDIDVWFTILWQDAKSSGSSCDTERLQLHEFPDRSSLKGRFIEQQFGSKNIQIMQQFIGASMGIQVGDSKRLALGVEKNPWYLVYSGFRAKSRPRQMFFPFGDPVEFEAVAYASPFGGRIGPWYGSFWASGASASSGAPSQTVPEKISGNGVMNTTDAKKMMPRYGRFPGDNLGLTSYLAQAAFTNYQNLRAEHKDYADILSNIGERQSNDLLPAPNPNTNVRDYEIAAIAPDLFDITYYSIEPDFDGVYLPRIRNRSVYQKWDLTGMKFPRGDLGSFDANGKHNNFSAMDQMARSRAALDGKVDLIQPDLFWVVKDRAHLLTSWVHNELYGNYNFTPQETKRFGKCEEWHDKFPENLKLPGACVDGGGRTGYSVKIVSGDYLRSALPLGGEGQGPAPIANPPPANW